MKYWTNFIIGFLLLLVLISTGCINYDDSGCYDICHPPTPTNTYLMLISAQSSIGYIVGSSTPALYVQHMAETMYTDSQRYTTVRFDFSGFYYHPIEDLQTIIDLNSYPETADDALTGGSNANQIAVARILKAYFFHFMTDRWGYLPYRDAFHPEKKRYPTYDSQEYIYRDLIKELKEAVIQMDDGEVVKGDIIFDGEMDRWKVFANTLRMRIALRMSNVDPVLAKVEFTKAFTDVYITEDVMYPFSPDRYQEHPWYSRFETRSDFAISDVLANTMKAYRDVRLLAYASPAPNLDNGNGVADKLSEISGMPYHIEDAQDIPIEDVSLPGMALRGPYAPLAILTLSEVHFMLAEAAARGWIAEDAETHYLAGIEASFKQWGVYNPIDFNAYITQPDILFDPDEWKRQIAYQKWIAFYGQGYQAWAEWRRLGLPSLVPHPYPLNRTGEIPLRHAYSEREAEYNKENYEAAVVSQGRDYEGTALWWDR